MNKTKLLFFFNINLHSTNSEKNYSSNFFKNSCICKLKHRDSISRKKCNKRYLGAKLREQKIYMSDIKNRKSSLENLR